MKYTIEIECGETTCASAPGKFCRFLGSRCFGVVPICLLYNEEIFGDAQGWLKRLPKCCYELKAIK